MTVNEERDQLTEKNSKSTVTGLSSQDVQERVASGKVNGDQNLKTKSVAQIIRGNALTFFNVLFIALAVLLAFFVPKGMEGLANFGFLFVVVINLLIGVFQELRAKRTIDKLSLLSSPKATVIRDGEKKDIHLKDIVLDDIMLLSAGKQITADAKLLEGSLEVNESLITGESDAMPKKAGDELLSGSFVVSGSGKAEVIRVGKDNYVSKISSGAKYIKPTNSVILKSVRKFIKIMAIIILPLGLALFSMKFFAQKNDLNETVLTVAATIIGMIPSGLMLLTTGVFGISVIRLSSYKALAQDLYCVETLARVDVLCLDKTGTITEGSMEVTNIIPMNATDREMRFALRKLTAAIKDTNPTAEAVEDYVKNLSIEEFAHHIVPFSSERKWSGASFKSGSLILGASEFIFKKITKKMEKVLAEYSESGMRVLVLAHSDKDIKDKELPKGLKLMGYILISDKIRKEAPETLRYFKEQGVTIKIISGDNAVTVKSIAEKAGVTGAENYVDMSSLEDSEVEEAAEKYTVFGRVTPERKLMLVKALKAQGHTVAMTGDGVNDVLALKEADCSIAMAAGSDAAKNVSQLVLLDSNFRSMPKIVAEGRRSINNLERSSSLFLVKTGYNFLFAFLFLIIQADLPFLPKHLTLLGMVTIGIPSYLLALEPNKERVKGKFFSKVLNNALPAAITIAISVVGIVLLSRLGNLTKEEVSTMSVIVTATVGFTYLAKISYPFNAFRTTLLIVMIAVFIGAFFADFRLINLTAFFGLTTSFTPDMLKIMIPVTVLSVPLFVLIYLLFNRLGKRGRAKRLSEVFDKH